MERGQSLTWQWYKQVWEKGLCEGLFQVSVWPIVGHEKGLWLGWNVPFKIWSIKRWRQHFVLMKRFVYTYISWNIEAKIGCNLSQKGADLHVLPSVLYVLEKILSLVLHSYIMRRLFFVSGIPYFTYEVASRFCLIPNLWITSMFSKQERIKYNFQYCLTFCYLWDVSFYYILQYTSNGSLWLFAVIIFHSY